MKPVVTIRELPDLGAVEWDNLLTAYPEATVFHSSAWQHFLDESLPGKVVRFQVELDGDVCGHWAGYVVNKFGVRVFGSPLPGTATDYMHPLFSTRPPVACFIDAVHGWARKRRIALVELGGGYFDEGSLVARGYTFHPTTTYSVDLAGGTADVWEGLKPAMRNKVRKAETNGVVVVEDDTEVFPRRFYNMLKEVFNRQGLAPTYDLGRIEDVVRLLRPSGHLVGMSALRENELLASVILLFDRSTAYYWAGASYTSAYPVGANDMIQWRALELAVGRGLTRYDTCGGGDYKSKLGGSLLQLPAGHRNVFPLVGLLRTSVATGFRAKQTLVGRLQRARQGRR